MVVTEQIKQINKKLIEVYGLDVSVSKPNFRVVWSSDQYEWRNNDPHGFDIFGDNDIFLRVEYGSKEVEKYPVNQDMWVLEELHDAVAQTGILERRYSYEPKWFFGLANSNRKPIWRATELLVRAILYARSQEFKGRIDSPAEVGRMEDRKMAKEKVIFKDMLDDASPYLVGALLDGSAVSVPNKEFVKEDISKEINNG